VIRTAHASVLVVRKRSEESYRRVAVAVDFSPQSATVVREACRLAPEAALQLIHAIDIPLTFQQAMLRAGTPRIEIQEYRSARANKARDDLSIRPCRCRSRQSDHSRTRRRPRSGLGPSVEGPPRRSVGNRPTWSRPRSPGPSGQRDAAGA
jgi:hypothetical protein